MTTPINLRAQLGQFIDVPELGLLLRVALNDDGQPTVTIDTEDMRPEYIYDDRTGLSGTADPYTVVLSEDGDTWADVLDPNGERVSRHFPSFGHHARFTAQRYADDLNKEWAAECGAPDIQVLLNDATIYDSEDHNPELRRIRGRVEVSS